MSADMDGRFAPPQAVVDDIQLETQPLAGRWTRLAAALIDVVIALTALIVITRIPAIKHLAPSLEDSSGGMTTLRLQATIVGIVIFLVVQAWPLVSRGQTIGKMICGLRIVRSDGAKVDAWRLLGLRYGIGFLMNATAATGTIYGLLDCLLIFRKSRKCLHDSIADTKVIKL